MGQSSSSKLDFLPQILKDLTFFFFFFFLATYSSILAWRITWTEEAGGLQSMGSQRVGNDLSNLTHVQGTRINCNWKTRRQYLSKMELENDYCAQYYLKTPISYVEFILLFLKLPCPLSSITF